MAIRYLISVSIFWCAWICSAESIPDYHFDYMLTGIECNYTGPDTLYVDSTCTAILEWDESNDLNCESNKPGGVIVSQNLESISGGYQMGDSVPAGVEVVVTYRVRDNMGNTEFFSFSIHFVDTLPPVFDPADLPADTALINSSDYPPADLHATDNCDPDGDDVVITVEDDPLPNICTGGTWNRAYTAIDPYGNETEYVQVITQIPDTVPPVFIVSPADSTVLCKDMPEAFTDWLAQQYQNTVVENEAGGVPILSDNAPDPQDLEDFCGTLEVEFTATDSCGNASSVTAFFTVQDTLAPTVVKEPEPLYIDCTQSQAMDQLQDWLDNHGYSEVEDECGPLVYEFSHQLGSNFVCNDTVGVSWVVSDPCGNSVEIFTDLYISDTLAPLIEEHPGDEVSNCAAGDLGEQFLNWLNEAGGAVLEDGCTASEDIGISFFYGSMEKSESELWAIFVEGFESGCEDSLTANGAMINKVLAHIAVDFHFSDFCGNTVISQAKFIAVDDQPPAITQQPADMEVPCGPEDEVQLALMEWLESGGGLVADDNCSDWHVGSDYTFDEWWQSYVLSRDTSCGNTGEVSVLFFAEDACGNRMNASKSVVFSTADTLAPMVVTPPEELSLSCVLSTSAQLEDWISNYGYAEVVDDCSDVVPLEFEWISSEGDTGSGHIVDGPYPELLLNTCNMYWDFTFHLGDGCGSEVSFTARVEITDENPPSFEGSQDTVFHQCDEDIQELIIEVEDFCSAFELNTTDSLLAESYAGCGDFEQVWLRTYEAIDVCGNTGHFEQILVVGDFEAPAFTVPPDMEVSCEDFDDLDLTGTPDNISDGCFSESDITITYEDVFEDSDCPNFVNRTWTLEDPCGNAATAIQQIYLIDTFAPELIALPEDLSLECGNPDIFGLFNQWLETGGGAVVEDVCSEVNFFAAVPGSYELDNPATYPGITPQITDFLPCDSIVENKIIGFEVHFVYYDGCGNAIVVQSAVEIVDETAPEILNCPSVISIDAATGECEGVFHLPNTAVYDACGATYKELTLLDSADITSDIANDPNEVVHPVRLSFFHPFNSFQPPQSLTLEIELMGVDGEQPTEVFLIYSEEDALLGQTENTDQQCGNSSTVLEFSDIQLLTSWLADDSIVFYLEPLQSDSLPGSFYINDLCDPGLVVGALHLQLANQRPIDFYYQHGLELPVKVSDFPSEGIALPAGNHPLLLKAVDCAGNYSVCQAEIEVVQSTPPMIGCGEDLNGFTGQDDCVYSLPMQELTYQSECLDGGWSVYSHPLDEVKWITFNLHPDWNEFQAAELTLNFSPVYPSHGGSVDLFLEYRADVDTNFAFFELLSANGEVLGNTKDDHAEILRMGSCSQSGLARFSLEDSLFNSLIENNELSLRLRQNPNIPFDPNASGLAINPCNGPVVQNGDSDGISFARAYVRFHPVEIEIFTEGATQKGGIQFYLGEEYPEIDLYAGVNTVHYAFIDLWGNRDTCAHTVDVLDTVPPNAICKNAIVMLNPSVFDTLELERALVDGASTDNCEIVNYEISPSKFNCLNIGSEISVQLKIFDAFGNQDSCASIVRFEPLIIQPSFSLDLCNPDTLFLFSNAPGDPVLYSYEWSGPQNFTSNSPNPVISGAGPVNSGSYSVTITGFGGCTSSGSVNVTINTIATPSLQTESKVVCEGDNISLMSSTYPGQISYRWYSGSPPSGVLLGTTSQPTFSTSMPQGNHSFYVIAQNPQCSSNPSGTLNIEVVEEPEAVIDPVFFRVCEGESMVLSSPLGAAYSYQWSGPADFVSDLQNPLVTASASSIHQGTYSLVVGLGTCVSRAVEAEVLVDASPVKPIVQGTSSVCEGDSIQLRVSNIPIATRYTWIFPDGSQQFTPINQLLISSPSPDMTGEWRVVVDFGQCSSELSESFFIQIDEIPTPTLYNSSPVCQGDTVLLASSPVQGATYQWSGPGGSQFTGDSIRSPLPTGNYQLTITTPAGCVQTASTTVINKVRPHIQGIVSQGFECADGNTDYCFQSVVFPADDGSYTYHWTGPNNFSSSQVNGCIPNISESKNGLYHLVVSADGCESAPETIEVEVTDIGFTPEISPAFASYCEGDTIQLSSNVSPGPEVLFHWITPAGVVFGQNPFLIFPSAEASMEGEYSLFVSIGQCSTSTSNTSEIEVRPKPEIPILSGGGSFCEGDSILLSVVPKMDEMYFWEGPAGFEQGRFEQFLWPASMDMQGNYRVVALADGCLSDPSVAQTVVIKPQPPVPVLNLDVESICLDDEDFVFEICVEQDSLIGGTAFNFFLNDDLENPFVSGSALCRTVQDPSFFLPGSNTLQVVATLNGCSSGFSMPHILRGDIIPDESAYAGDDFLSCESDDIFLLADSPSQSTGKWSSPKPSLVFENPETPVSVVNNLKPGLNTLIWSLSSGSCKNFDRDTVLLEYLDAPIARDLSTEILIGEDLEANLLANDYLPSSVVLTLLNVEGEGSVFLDENQILHYRGDERWAGTVRVRYRICLEPCPEKCDEAELTIEVGDDMDCTIPNIFTPNGDGINDSFIIQCLSESRYANNSLKIFDQWGSRLFHAAPYQNDWEGTHNGNPLPEGTYFYVLDFGVDGSERSGFVIIKR
nr:gliding motility-associated C-terminal domain-containing protein [Saprospiraceae bacterium]